MKQEAVTFKKIPVRRSTRNRNNVLKDPLVKIEEQQEENERLKRRLRQPAKSELAILERESSIITDGTNSAEETLERVNNSIQCEICNLTYESLQLYLTHQIQMHKNENFCTFCNRTFKLKSYYHNHLVNIHATKIRNRVSTIRYPDRTPDINDPENYCNACDHTFASKASYRIHLKNVHDIKVSKYRRQYTKIRYPDKIPDIHDPNNFCSTCDYTFTSKNGYHYHLEFKHAIKMPKKHRQKIEIVYPDRVPDVYDSNNFCNCCDYTFTSKNGYHYHLKNMHSMEVPKNRH